MQRLKIAILGRTEMLFDAGVRLHSAGHSIPFVATCKASGHELKSEHDFETWARDIGAAFVRGPRLQTSEMMDAIKRAGCDVAISMNWVELIPSQVRDAFRHGIYNAHPGDLPRYKGNACPNWAILLGEPHIALSIHRMVDALDSGPIAAKSYFPLGPQTSIGDVYDWLRAEVPSQFCAVIEALAAGSLLTTDQPELSEFGLRCYPRRPEDARIDWAEPAMHIHRLIRASGRPFDATARR